MSRLISYLMPRQSRLNSAGERPNMRPGGSIRVPAFMLLAQGFMGRALPIDGFGFERYRAVLGGTRYGR
jgi:hypothetical protein